MSAVSDPQQSSMRWILLVFVCLLTFGSYYSFDMPSVMKKQLKSELELTDLQYNMLYSLYSWANMAVVLMGGVLIDKTSNSIGAILFLTLICIGQSVLSVGVSIKSYGLMLAGRLIFGAGGGPICVVQNSFAAVYFAGAELSLALGLTLTAARLGSVLNFFLSYKVYEATSFEFVFWLGAMLCGFSMLCALCLVVLNRSFERKQQEALDAARLAASQAASKDTDGEMQAPCKASRKVSLSDIKEFNGAYWLVCGICVAFYVNVFAFMAEVVDFLEDEYDYSQDNASLFSSLLYLVSIPFTIFFGKMVDRVGRRADWMFVASAGLLLFDLLVQFTRVHPAVSLTVAGICYALMASSLWSGIILLVPARAKGSALGIATAIQMLGIGISNMCVGAILDASDYTTMMIFFDAVAMCSMLLCLGLKRYDARFFDGKFNGYKQGCDLPDFNGLLYKPLLSTGV
eukprot:GFYU01010833.1.p1 GENE.GFYU01010833.1~~GFYU01010833.1.p1  ORF type:complete len:458 (-),score=119.38 GFYU01010833.1:100-1473(-)